MLDGTEIDAIIVEAPADLLTYQKAAAAVPLNRRPTMGSWLDRFNAARTTV
ncbi:hypothetical protein QLH51_05645 [Sphingomonas sp. 2R-10]|uniref:hypothetical protein n=1 Tax=Sphingomonas sp. 2R-10 TaxID=3045148 RepID=UPI0019D1A308|nr:hypothetical protein [Sphingomonas sp. 2R-10]MDJ0276281.1 hypothetical protein [Sphingomonas sp. 2R-10]